jgi:DNA repair exonuclease SbcCD nuclease subunit
MIDVLLTDTHFGWKNNSITWLNSQMDFIYKQFIPYIKQLQKKDSIRVIHLGDVFDSRSTISTYVASKVVKAFEDIRNNCNEFIIVCGNHDFYSPNSDTVNTVKLLMNNLDIVIVDQEIFECDNHTFIPWYVWENNNFEVNGKYVFCHADIVGDVIPYACNGKTIFSGHIHTPNCNKKKGLYNLGSCYSLNFADANSERGFYVIENDKINFIKNTVSINFYRFYNDDILNKDITKLNNNDYIELYVTEYNMSKDEYIAVIKKYTEYFRHLWIIPQIVPSNNTGESFNGYDIEAIMNEMIPEDLMEFYNKVKHKIKSQ